jgi:hypothetical protein
VQVGISKQQNALRQQKFWYRPYRTIGRFAALRRAYGWVQARRPFRDVGTPPPDSLTLFPELSPEESRTALYTSGIHLGLRLSGEITDSIRRFARMARCTRPGFDENFHPEDVRNGALRDGRQVPVADVHRPLECEVLAAIKNDPRLLAAAHLVLGYRSRRVAVRLFWSFAGPIPDETRRALGQTIDFHYDVPWFNSVYVYFYLTPVDQNSGAHVMYRGSAKNKPLAFLLSSCVGNEQVLRTYYGPEREMAIEGPAGFGFLVDPFGYHKALPPLTNDRLMLQLRYC